MTPYLTVLGLIILNQAKIYLSAIDFFFFWGGGGGGGRGEVEWSGVECLYFIFSKSTKSLGS